MALLEAAGDDGNPAIFTQFCEILRACIGTYSVHRVKY